MTASNVVKRKAGADAGSEEQPSYTISDLARAFGVTLRTLRFYENRGLLSPRREGTARLYDESDKGRLAVILKGKQLGFTLTEIRAMLARDARGASAPAELKLTLPQIEEQIAHLEGQKRDIDEALTELKTKRKVFAEA